MIANRSDAWTPDDDMLLAETVLRHIREGSSQLRAFDEVAQRLGRTPGACGFRWNACVRKNYEGAIQIAKAQKQQLKSKTNKRNYKLKTDANQSLPLEESNVLQQINFDAVIGFLRTQKTAVQELERKVRNLEKELKEMQEENKKLKETNETLRKEYASSLAVKEDYEALVQIMERARRLAILGTEREEAPVFKMDQNGNLERVAK